MTNSDTSNTHKHPKTPTNTHKTPTNTHKEWCYHTFVKEWMKALDKTRILAPSDYFYHFSFPRYGRLKSKFLCERYSHCIFSSCSIDLTKTRYTWSLTAVVLSLIITAIFLKNINIDKGILQDKNIDNISYR